MIFNPCVYYEHLLNLWMLAPSETLQKELYNLYTEQKKE